MPKVWDKSKGTKKVPRVPKSKRGTRKPLTIAEIDAEVAKLEKQRDAIFVIVDPLQAEASILYSKMARLINEKDKMLIASKKRVDWAGLLDVTQETNAKFKFRSEQLRKLGLMDPFGHWSDTKQTIVKIALNKHESLSNYWRNDRQLKAVKKLLPFIKVATEGCKKIDIFEHTLSIGGNHWLEFYGDGRIQLGRSHGGVVQFKSIEEAFKYVSQNLWYESNDPDDNFGESFSHDELED